jgi:hypothetical protein
MSRSDTLPTMPTIRSERAPTRSFAVLIEVPKVKARSGERHQATARARRTTRYSRTNRTRRRLRRPVRIAGCVLLALVAFSVCTLGWSNRPTRIIACSIAGASSPAADTGNLAGARDRKRERGVPADTAHSSSDAVLLSVESTATAPGADAAAVVLPGYILPDDRLEDRAHEGS